jgi:NAD(P)H-dependent flavin oxidoreductase YrpB (nitropropane dioxygenase family)
MNDFCRRLELAVPIVQAPVGSATTPELAAAVSNAGGLGTLALSWTPAEEVQTKLRVVRELTDRPIGVNLVLEWPQRERLSLLGDQHVAVVWTHWSDPAPYVEEIHALGALHLHTVGSSEHAVRAVAAGVDAVVAQGWEAGGHVCGEVATLALVPSVVDAVSPTPVIAAGGIADGRGIAAALVLGAQAAALGTRFLLACEANTDDEYRSRLIDASEADTIYSTVFDGGWPNAPHRALVNSTVRAWDEAGRPRCPNRPGEGEAVARTPDGRELLRYGDDIPVRGVSGETEALAHYAGQSVGLVRSVQSASTIVNELATQLTQALTETLSNTVHA